MREPREHQSLRVSSFLFADESQLMLRCSNVNCIVVVPSVLQKYAR